MTDLAALEVLVGEWTAEAVDPGSGEPIRGTMTVEWLEGGGYLVQRTTLENPVFPRTLAMIGPDRAGRIVQHYFDSRGVARVYEALVLGVPDAHDLKRLARGVTIDDRPTLPAIVKILRTRAGGAVLEITVREGRNRQVRRMCEAIGHPVSQLTRVAIGPLRDSRLKSGQWRDLADAEILRLRTAAARTAIRDEHPGGDRVVATSPPQRTRATRRSKP